jgi:hypothetical protein
MFFCFVLFVCSAGYQTQGLAHARQATTGLHAQPRGKGFKDI